MPRCSSALSTERRIRMRLPNMRPRNMRVAILSAPPDASHGWGRYTRDLITGLATQQVEVVLITSPDASDDPRLPVAGYHRILPSFVAPGRFKSLRLLAAIPAVMAATASCDLVHAIVEPYALCVPLR